MYRFLLPDIGEGVVEAEVIEWKVREGERVVADQTLVELMTDKANIEIPSPVAGVVHRLGFPQGAIVPVGAVLIEIDDGVGATASVTAAPPMPAAASQPAAASREPAGASARASEPAAAHPPAMPARPGLSHHRAAAAANDATARAVPAVRELAKRLGVDLARVAGTGPAARIMRRDVEEAARAPQHAAVSPPRPQQVGPAPPVSDLAERQRSSPVPPANDPQDWKRIPLRGLRRAIARHMREARHKAAHFTYVEELDLTALLERSDDVAGQKLSPLAFIARAVVRALPSHPALNASLDEERDEIVYKQKIHLGVAVAAADGLLVPVIRDAAALTTRDLALATEALARRAREGKLTPDELRGGTFTISSLGKLGGIVSTPIVNYPEVAILGVNAIRKLPRFVGERVEARRLMNLSISVDHRVADGHNAAQFVADLKTILEAADFPDVFGKEGQP